jgi:uncharacterized membrane protein YkvA (DUF1232 family)
MKIFVCFLKQVILLAIISKFGGRGGDDSKKLALLNVIFVRTIDWAPDFIVAAFFADHLVVLVVAVKSVAETT